MLPAARLAIALLVVGGSAAAALCFVVPPFQAPDEWSHLFAARQASSLRLMPDTEGGSLLTFSTRMEKGLVDFAAVARAWQLPHHRDRSITIDELRAAWATPRDDAQVIIDNLRFTGSPGFYPSTSYPAPGLALAGGRALGCDPATTFYGARIANLMLFALLVLLACRLAPSCAPLWAGVALLPMSLSVAASLSGDVVAIGASLVLAAMCVRSCRTDVVLSWRDAALFVVAAVALAMAKGVYGALVGVWLVLPGSASGGRGRHLALGVAALALCCVLVWGWAGVQGYAYGFAASMNGISPDDNARWLLAHPWSFVAATLRSLVHPAIVGGAMGRLGWLDVELPLGAQCAAFAALASGIALARLPDHARVPRRALIGAICLAAAAACAGLGWLYGVYGYPLGAPSYFPSIQGRHLVPLLPWIGLAIVAGARTLPQRLGVLGARVAQGVLLAGSAAAAAGALFAVIGRYYR